MPSTDEHLQKAGHNETFVESFDLSSTPYLDWVVTGIFYATLHYVDALLAIRGIHPGNHNRRDREVQLYLSTTLYLQYRALKDASQEARYELRPFTGEEIDKQIKPRFHNLKNEILSLLP